jgi:4-hydroxybenzoate polyprenyltransferase
LKFLKPIFDFILFGNVYVALGCVSLIQSSVIQLQLDNHLISYSLLTFFATIFVYNFQRIFYKVPENVELNSIRRVWIFNQNTIKLLILLGFVGAAITFLFNDFRVLFYLSPLLVLSLIYFAPFVKLRKSPWLKLVTLTLVWTMVTAVVPVLLVNATFTKNDLLHIIARFWFMVAICIPFDIRDLQIDKADSVSTIPFLLGERKARGLAFVCSIVYSVLIVGEYWLGMVNTKIAIALLLFAIINTALVLMSTTKRSEYFYVAGIDGTMILQGVLLLLANQL